MYNPYDKENDHSELIESRTKLVLRFMKEQNRISDNPEEAEKLYNEAVEKVEKGLKFKKEKYKLVRFHTLYMKLLMMQQKI